ncbi:glycosyl hydrolase 53 family protein [Butyrivibrio sp. YAB3001]|uniref:glycosyl hydrolase 53 family protein n=1 Tax=Butyrivibrio sp. YAB3001 TaxID=1520812 RepID=UPI0008F669FB|nr:glycosyl hydrolase 53 family protein [Butyrivibrio sp. YAB3001]SFB81807.1 arabinogalactan endo-1,4-beta-galactosidase [Butyrivibrio sp. YAB3001]
MKKRKLIEIGTAVMVGAIIAGMAVGCGKEAATADTIGEANVEGAMSDEQGEEKDAAADSGMVNGETTDESEKKDDVEATVNDDETNLGEAVAEGGANEDDIFVEKVENLPEDFICGMDASSVLVEENSGVKYYNFQGEEADVFKTMAEAGVNCIRLRVWNDPYDAEGNGYGGGNNDVTTAITLGKRATDAGMQVMIDFHYSDFWADPKKQFAPKAWEGMDIDEKCSALEEFTTEALGEILDAGVNVTFVQIGNEINNGMSGESSLPNVTRLLDSGSKAVRKVAADRNKNIQIIVHYTNIEDGGGKVPALVSNLENNGIDYDIVGLSYYPYWHGDLENMQNVVKKLIDRYGKKVMLVETSYPYTTSDGDDSGNSFDGKKDLIDGYSASVQGQAHMIRDIIASANEGGACGVCYWEGVWIPVGSSKNTNNAIWEKYGSGWASRFAKDYDPNDAGKYYGGCSWDNQAMFDFKGYPLQSLNVFKYVYEGHSAGLKVESVPDIEITVQVGEEVKLPTEAPVIYNDPSVQDSIEIVWDEADLAKLDTSKGGKITLHGTLKNEENSRVICHLEVKEENFVKNPSFEDKDLSMWKIDYANATNPTDYQNKKDDAHDGSIALHFWNGREDIEFTASQEISGLEAGTYQLECFAQGGDTDDTAKMELFCETSDGKQMTEEFAVTSWAQWKNPVITNIQVTDGVLKIGVSVKSNVASWGTIDDFVLKKVQ